MAYEVSEDVRESLNIFGLWHGRAELLISAEEWEELYQWDPPHTRWNNPYWDAFGGLYVTGERDGARVFARHATERVNFWYDDPDEWPPGLDIELPIAEAIIHRVRLLEGVKVAIDEDEFGWGAMTADFVENRPAPWKALRPPEAVHPASDLYKEIQSEMNKQNEELEADQLGNYLYDPNEEYDFVRQLTNKWAGPILEHWNNTMGWPAPWNKPYPPKIRILNEYWSSDPPFGKTAM